MSDLHQRWVEGGIDAKAMLDYGSFPAELMSIAALNRAYWDGYIQEVLKEQERRDKCAEET